MAKKFLQKAIKRPGRVRRLLGKKEGEKITKTEIEAKRKQLKKSGKLDKSLSSALSLASRLVGGEFRPGRTKF